MRLLVIAAIAVALTLASSSRAQIPGDACDAQTFQQSCDATDATKLDICDPNNGIVTLFDCTTDAAGAACGTAPGCDGTGCATIPAQTCVAQLGGVCDGFALELDQDVSNDNLVGVVLCAGDATCKTTVDGTTPSDACVAHEGPACIAGEPTGACLGTELTVCVADADAAIASNLSIDCAALGADCGPQACTCDLQCGAGSLCADGFCDFGDTCTFAPDPGLCNGGDPQCASDLDCPAGEVCDGANCVFDGGGCGGGGVVGGGIGQGQICDADSDCGRHHVCVDGRCQPDGTLPVPGPVGACTCTSDLHGDNGARESVPRGALVVIGALFLSMARARRRAR